MKTASAKNKGRNLQKWVVNELLKYADSMLDVGDITWTSMGANGEDIKFSPKARERFPLSIECGNQEGFTKKIWDKYRQAVFNNPKPMEYVSTVVVKRNHENPLAIISLADLDKLLRRALCIPLVSKEKNSQIKV